MKKTGMFLTAILLSGCTTAASAPAEKQSVTEPAVSTIKEGEKETMENTIHLNINGNEIIFQLNDSAAAQSLIKQMPADVQISNYSSNEKIFYPSEKLDTSDTPMAEGKTGELAYFEPWGDVVMYYGEAGPYSGLYTLGICIQGQEYISDIPEGTIHIE